MSREIQHVSSLDLTGMSIMSERCFPSGRDLTAIHPTVTPMTSNTSVIPLPINVAQAELDILRDRLAQTAGLRNCPVSAGQPPG